MGNKLEQKKENIEEAIRQINNERNILQTRLNNATAQLIRLNGQLELVNELLKEKGK